MAAQGQPAKSSSQGLTIPFLANVTKRADLDFTAAECDISNGEQIACRFRQVFLTIPSSDTTTCVITTNGYEDDFPADRNDGDVDEKVAGFECCLLTNSSSA
jgi:hypothetical protein